MPHTRQAAQWRVDRVMYHGLDAPPTTYPLAWFIERANALQYCRAQEPGRHVRLVKEDAPLSDYVEISDDPAKTVYRRKDLV